MSTFQCWVHYDRRAILTFEADTPEDAAIMACKPLRRGQKCKIWASRKPNPPKIPYPEGTSEAWPTYFIQVARSRWFGEYTASHLGPEDM